MALRRKKAAYARPVVKVRASRAIYNEASGMLPTIALEFEMQDGEQVKFELTVTESAKLIEMMTASYYAIVPQLKVGRSPLI